jgi:hypothetical protein
LELPSRSRIAKAQWYIDQWHGAGIIHHNRFGRVRFNGILEPKWFRIDWQDGSSSEHTAHILRHLGHVDDGSLPEGVPGRPEPAVLLAAARLTAPNPMLTAEDFLAFIHERMPSARLTPSQMDSVLEAATQLRTQNVPRPPVLASESESLFAVLNVSCMSQMVVVAGAQGDGWVKFVRDRTTVPVVVNHPPGGAASSQPLVGVPSHLHLDPIGSTFSAYFQPAGGVDMFYVNIDPVLLDVVVPPLLEVCNKVVCLRFPSSWRLRANRWRDWWFYELEAEGRVLWVEPRFPDGSVTPFCWLCIFSDAEEKEAMTWCHADHSTGRVTAIGATITGQSWS